MKSKIELYRDISNIWIELIELSVDAEIDFKSKEVAELLDKAARLVEKAGNILFPEVHDE